MDGVIQIDSYAYDANGNQLSRISEALHPGVGLGIGFMGFGGEYIVYGYSSLNLQISAVVDGDRTEYTYRPNGMRLSKDDVTHVWDGSNICAELDGSGAVVDRFVRGIGLIMSDSQGFYSYNAHGDVVQITNDQGVVLREYGYDAFGVEKDIDENDSNPWRYCGEYYDKETDTVYLRFRSYDPKTGRFTSEDPIRDGLNWYTYCGGNPLRFFDPSGLVAVDVEEYRRDLYL